MGDSLDAILEECEAQDLPWPDEIAEHFDLREPWMDFYLQAYGDLSTCRGSSGYVPWLAIDRYAERFGFDDDFAIWFIRCIRSIDDAYIEVDRARQPQPQGSG